jgi:hypothetical protein
LKKIQVLHLREAPFHKVPGCIFSPAGSNQKIYTNNTVFIENRAFASNGAGLGVGLAVRGTGVSNDGGLIQLENCEFDSNSVFMGSVYCTMDAAISLVGSPSGGTFSGNGVSGQSFDPALAGVGNHSVQYDFTDGIGCADRSTTSTQVSVSTGIDSGPISENPFDVYPNPLQTTVNVRFLSQALVGWSIKVYDLHGKLQVGVREEAGLLRMDFSGLYSGIYFLRIEGDGQRYQEKVVKAGN